MGRSSGNFRQAWGYLFSRWGDPSAYADTLHDINNSVALSWADAADTTSIPAFTVDSDSLVHVNSAAVYGARQSANFFLNTAGAMVSQSFFVAPRAMAITAIEELHSTAETAAGTATAVITHDLAGQAPGTGTVVMTNSFNLKATANTVQSGTLLAVNAALGTPAAGIVLAAGDRLSILIGGTATITALAGVVITLFSRPGFKELDYTYNNATATIATQSFGLANRDLEVTSVWMTWSTAGTDAGAVTADVTIESGTTAPGSGTSCLAAAQSVKLAANTPVLVPLSATASHLLLRAGYRMSVKMTGTLTALAGLIVTVSTGPVGAFVYIGEVRAAFNLLANASQGTQGFWIADRDYEVVDFSAVASTAGTDGGAVTIDCTIDKGVVAPGAGSSCLAGTGNLKSAANTVLTPGVNTQRRQRLMSQGDLLSVKTSGTLTALAGVTATVSLQPR